MSTVSKEIADRIVAGEFEEDNIVMIIEYDNAWGGKGYGLIAKGQNPSRYAASPYICNPRVYWDRDHFIHKDLK